MGGDDTGASSAGSASAGGRHGRPLLPNGRRRHGSLLRRLRFRARLRRSGLFARVRRIGTDVRGWCGWGRHGWRRQERLQLDAERLALGDARSRRRALPLAGAVDDRFARVPEPLPQRVRLRPAHGSDRAPFPLRPLDLLDRRPQVGSIRKSLDARTEGLLLRQVLPPDLLALGEVGLAAGEEQAARPVEALPERTLLPPRHRPERLPLGLQGGQALRRLDPVRRLAESLGLLRQCFEGVQVARAGRALRLEVRLAARIDDIVRGLETTPEIVSAVLGDFRSLPPAVDQVAELAREGRLVHLHRTLAVRRGVDRCAQRLHLPAELLLDAEVGPPLPIGEVPELPYPAEQGGLRVAQAPSERRALRTREQRARFLERLPRAAEVAFRIRQLELVARGLRFDRVRQPLQAREPIPQPTLVLGVRAGLHGALLLLRRRAPARGGSDGRPDLRVVCRAAVSQPRDLRAPALVHRRPAAADGGCVGGGCQRLELRRQRFQALEMLEPSRPLAVPALAPVRRRLEPLRQGCHLGLPFGGVLLPRGWRHQCAPLLPRRPQHVEGERAPAPLHALAQRQVRGDRRGAACGSLPCVARHAVELEQAVLRGAARGSEAGCHLCSAGGVERGPALDERLDLPPAGVEIRRPGQGLGRFAERDGAGRIERRRLLRCVALACRELRPGSSSHHLVTRPPGDVGKRLRRQPARRRGEPIEGGKSNRLALRLDHDAEQLVPTVEPVQGLPSHLGMLRPPSHASEQLRVRQAGHGALADRLAHGQAGHGRDVTVLRQDGQHGIGPGCIGRTDEQVARRGDRRRPDARVGLLAASEQLGDQRRVRQALDRGAAHPGSIVVAGDLEQQVLLGVRQRTHGARAHGGVVTPPLGLGTEPVEEPHTLPP